ncbi:MAG: hypothetical protein ACRDGR_03615 [bacterium]
MEPMSIGWSPYNPASHRELRLTRVPISWKSSCKTASSIWNAWPSQE